MDAERSSSNDLSSAPNSDVEGTTSAHNISNTIIVSQVGSGPGPNGSAPKNIGNVNLPGSDRQEAAPKQRKPRKKKDSDVAAAPPEKKEKGTRRPRGASNAAAGSTRKKIKTEAGTPAPTVQLAPTSSDPVYPRPTQPDTSSPPVRATSASNEAAKFSQNGFLKNNPVVTTQNAILPHYNPTPPPPAPVSRPMAYDPVRSLTTPRVSEPPSNPAISHSHLSTPPRVAYNPSTSPAISSIINPPDPVHTHARPLPSSFQQQAESRPIHTVSQTTEDNSAMDVDSVKTETAKKVTPEAVPTKPAPKPRAKEQPPPLPTGSGLLSSSLFGGDSGMDANKDTNEKGTSIVLHVDLKNPSNKVINFARMAEEKYGFAALYPRQAAQKERLAKVAAAGAALERAGAGIKGTPAGESGDEDVSVDVDRDSDNDGDVAMSGMNGTGEAVNSGTDDLMPKRRKRKDEYDADDPFVDDSELLWEAQAAASKDGFFVYCGPLVPEGEKPTVERADGTVKRGRGRGRGGGPGSRGGRGAAAAARDTEGGSGRGGGPGSRGGGITRKPRITKAERAQRELEKKQREQMAVLAAKPPNYEP